MTYYKLFIAICSILLWSNIAISQKTELYQERVQELHEIIYSVFPEKEIGEFQLDQFSQEELLSIEMISYQKCLEHVSDQIQKKEDWERETAPISAQIKAASDEEFRVLIRKHKELLNTRIPIMDLEDEKGRNCKQIVKLNKEAKQRIISRQK